MSDQKSNKILIDDFGDFVQLYDVYQCSDRTLVRKAVTAATAAAIAGVSINFVVLSAKQRAKNKYGRVGTLTGYYFYHHGDVPEYDKGKVKEKPKPKPRKIDYDEPQYAVVKRWVFDRDVIQALLYQRGIRTAKDESAFYESLGLVSRSVWNAYNHGWLTFDTTNEIVWRLCNALELNPASVIHRRWVSVPYGKVYAKDEVMGDDRKCDR